MILVPILTILGLSYSFANYFKTRLIFAIPISVSLLISILYCFAMQDLLAQITYLSYFIGMILLLYHLFKMPNIKPHINEIIFISLIIIMFYLYTKGAYLHAYDDFCHWGVFTKELLNSGFFENQNSLSSIIPTHAHYPRGAAIYHYFMLLPSGYSEGNVLFAHFLLHLIFLAPLGSNKKFWHTGLLLSLILTAVVLYTTGLRSIYNDSTIGLMFGCIFAIYIIEENKRKALLLVLPIIMLLAFFREVGEWLAVLAGLIIILHNIVFHKQGRRKSDYVIYLLLLALPILCNAVWMNYFRDTHDFFARKEHSFNNLVFIAENFNEQHKLLLLNYGKFFLKFLVKEGSFVIYTLCGCAWYGIKKYKPKYASEYKFFLLATFFGYIVFSLWRLYLYFFTFTYAEAIRGASLLRYLGCYALGFGMIAAAYIKNSIFSVQETKQNRKELFILMVLFAISSFSVIKNILRIKQLSPTQQIFMEQSADIKNKLVQGEEINFNFSNKDDDLQCYILNYSLAPYLDNKILKECMKVPRKIEIDINLSKEKIYKPFIVN